MTDINTPKTSQTALAVRTEPAAMGERGIIIRNWTELQEIGREAAASGLVPKDFIGKPAACAIAMQMGLEIGLHPMQSLQSIAVINGRPGIFGDAALALVRASGLCSSYTQEILGEGDSLKAICTTVRQGEKYTQTFGVADAKRAGLWDEREKVMRWKDGKQYEAKNDAPWHRYPGRMLMFRARGYLLRDAYPDVLKGMRTIEELEDMPPEKEANASVVGTEQPAGINTPKVETKKEGKKRGAKETPPEPVAAGQPSEAPAPAGIAGGPPPAAGILGGTPADDYSSAMTPAATSPKDAPTAENDSILAEVLDLMKAAEMTDQDVADAAFSLAITAQRAFPKVMAITELLTIKKRFGEVVRKSLAIKEERSRPKLTPARP